MANRMLKLKIDPNLIQFLLQVSMLTQRIVIAISVISGNDYHLTWPKSKMVAKGPLHPKCITIIIVYSNLTGVHIHSFAKEQCAFNIGYLEM